MPPPRASAFAEGTELLHCSIISCRASSHIGFAGLLTMMHTLAHTIRDWDILCFRVYYESTRCGSIICCRYAVEKALEQHCNCRITAVLMERRMPGNCIAF
eukprot:1145240-Pelagomonas_calceolata.AAC.4